MRVPVQSASGADAVRDMELSDYVFGVEPNVGVMHQALVRQMANARLGTHKTKKRSERRGGGRKPWRQKGTGRARQGSIRAPQWRGGGVVFGPVPRSYDKKMNRKMRRLALRSALSVKVADGEFMVIDSLEFSRPKTKDMVALLEKLDLDGTVLMLLADADRNVILSARNLPNIKTQRANCLSVRDLLGYEMIVATPEAVAEIESVFGKS